MPSQKPRLALTLTPELRDALTALSEALGQPASTLVVEFLVGMIPQFEGITKMTIAAKSGNKAAAKRALVHMVGDQMAGMLAMHTPDMFPKKKGAKS